MPSDRLETPPTAGASPVNVSDSSPGPDSSTAPGKRPPATSAGGSPSTPSDPSISRQDDDPGSDATPSETSRGASEGVGALAVDLLARGVDAGPVVDTLTRAEKPGVVARVRRLLLGPDEGRPLADELAGMTPHERLAHLERLIGDGDARVTGADLAAARSDVELERLRAPANARRAEAERVAYVEGLARDVLDVLDGDDEDLAAARLAWFEVVEAARRAVAHATNWQNRAFPAVSRFDGARTAQRFADVSSSLVDEARARCVAMTVFGTDAACLAIALGELLDPSAPRRASSVWGRMEDPADIPTPPAV